MKEVSLELQDGNVSWTTVNIHRFEQILTAHPTEDECNHVWYGRPSIGDTVCGKCGIQEVHTAEDEPSRYQIALEVQAEYLSELNKYSKEKSWEEGQSQSGLFMWLGMKLHQEDK